VTAEGRTGIMFPHYRFIDYATQVYLAWVALLILLFHGQTLPHWAWLVAGHGLCLGAIHGLIRRQAQGKAGRITDFLRHFYPVLLYTGFYRETGVLNRMICRDYLDPVLIGWEQKLFGAQPSVVFMETFPHLAVSELFYLAYASYYFMIAGVGLALFFRNRAQFFHYVSVISFVFYVCYTIYIFVPVIGPRVFFSRAEEYTLPAAVQCLAVSTTYPDAVRSGPFYNFMAVIYQIFEAPGAAMPSSHVAIAWCTVYFSFRYLPRIRHLHLAMAVLLSISTVYCRYHYTLDVIAGALPAAVLLPLGNWLYWRFEKPGTQAGRLWAEGGTA
jgi:membrane-associated phospholipid phosphatase